MDTYANPRMATDIETMPVLDAYILDSDGCLAVWCIHCRRWHFHGVGDGHRVAHCDGADSPYQRTGYVLQETGLAVPRYKNGRPRPPEGA